MELLEIRFLAESLKIKETNSLERSCMQQHAIPLPAQGIEEKASWTLKTCLNRQCRGGGGPLPGRASASYRSISLISSGSLEVLCIFIQMDTARHATCITERFSSSIR